MTTRAPKTYSTIQQAIEQAVEIVRQHVHMIPGLRGGIDTLASVADRAKTSGDYFNLEWERSFGVGCSLSLSIGHGRLEQEETRIVHHRKTRVEVGWSSTGRSPAEAMAAIALYQQVAQLACLIESVLRRMEIAEIIEKAAQ